nr:DUF3037 domain-containing protein [Luteimonas salinisoli]
MTESGDPLSCGRRRRAGAGRHPRRRGAALRHPGRRAIRQPGQSGLDAIVAVCRGGPDSGPIGRLAPRARFHALTATRSAVIQMSPVHTGQCAGDPAETLRHLMQRMVLPLAPGGAAEPDWPRPAR